MNVNVKNPTESEMLEARVSLLEELVVQLSEKVSAIEARDEEDRRMIADAYNGVQ